MKTSKILFAFVAFFIAGTAAFAANKVVKVACVGDSITYGMTIVEKNPQGSYPVALGNFLGEGFEVRNFGNSGKTAGDYPGQGNRWLGKNKEHVGCTEYQADIVISNLGINDTGAWWNADIFEKGYEKLIEDWLGGKKARRGVKFLMWTQLAPDFRGPKGQKAWPGNVYEGYDFKGFNAGTIKNHDEVHKLLKKIAKKYKAYELDAYSPLYTHPEMYAIDGLHPNALGAKRIAEFTFAKLVKEKLVKIKRPQPKFSIKDGNAILKNDKKVAILLDDSFMLQSATAGKFVFENATVIPPESELKIELGGEKNQKDPASTLVWAQAKNASDVRLVPVKGNDR